MENTPGLIKGRHNHHYQEFKRRLEASGYQVDGQVYDLEQFGLPQTRKRAIVIAAREAPLLNLHHLWEGWNLCRSATTVKNAIGPLQHPEIGAGMPNRYDHIHEAPGFSKSGSVLELVQAIPHDGGSWASLMADEQGRNLVIPSARKRYLEGRASSYNDVYGRLWWDKPAVTIKRECSHVGNGRYTHPEQDRLLTVREMSILQGFPHGYQFSGDSKSNLYRQIGDAVPPIISYQLSALITWMKTGQRPSRPVEWVLPNSSLSEKFVSSINHRV